MASFNKGFCAIMQPTYLPWAGYFDLIDQTEIFVFLDNVQVVKRDWDIRNRIKTSAGELFLTVPIRKTHSRNETLFSNACLADDTRWKRNHLTSIRYAYSKAQFFDPIYSILEEILLKDWRTLSELNSGIIMRIAEGLKFSARFAFASRLTGIAGKRDELLASICKSIGYSRYLSPQGSSAYIEAEEPGGAIVRNGIDLFYMSYTQPIYQQLHGPFLSHLSVIDLLFNYGFERGAEVIRSGRSDPLHFLEFRRMQPISGAAI